MDPTKKGTSVERALIRELLADDNFKKLHRYENHWTSMFNAAASDAYYHCGLIAKSLSKCKYSQLHNLPLPSFRKNDDNHLSIPSISFVVTKLYKTLDLKLGKGGKGNFNASHSHEWIRITDQISEMLSDGTAQPRILFLPTTRTYDKLTTADRAYMTNFVMDTVDSDGDGTDQSEEADNPVPCPNPVDATN